MHLYEDVQVVMISDHSNMATIANSGIVILRHKETGLSLFEIDILQDWGYFINDCCIEDSTTPESCGTDVEIEKMTFTFSYGSERLSVILPARKQGGIEVGPKRTDSEIHVSCCDLTEASLTFWHQLKQMLDIPQIHVAYTTKIAEIINSSQYHSDLDPWILWTKDQPSYLETYCTEMKDDPGHKEDVDNVTRFLQIAREEALCTVHMCQRSHPCPVRGTLYPWKTKPGNSQQECDYNQCDFCGGNGGKDGGIFSGETLLHIAIVNQDFDLTKWMLDRGAHLDDVAAGLFWTCPRVPTFAKDLKSFNFSNLGILTDISSSNEENSFSK